MSLWRRRRRRRTKKEKKIKKRRKEKKGHSRKLTAHACLRWFQNTHYAVPSRSCQKRSTISLSPCFALLPTFPLILAFTSTCHKHTAQPSREKRYHLGRHGVLGTRYQTETRLPLSPLPPQIQILPSRLASHFAFLVLSLLGVAVFFFLHSSLDHQSSLSNFARNMQPRKSYGETQGRFGHCWSRNVQWNGRWSWDSNN